MDEALLILSENAGPLPSPCGSWGSFRNREQDLDIGGASAHFS